MPRPMSDRQPLGIFGGTFDPVHFGHLRLAEEACGQLGLAEVLWIPAGQPSHRGTPRCTGQHRLEMVRRAIAGNAAFRLDEAEALSAAPSYSVPTLERLRAEHGGVGAQRPLVLLLGVDAFLGLASWHRWQELFDLAHIAVATRPGSLLDEARMPQPLAAEFAQRRCASALDLNGAAAGRILPFAITALDISATRLRSNLVAGHSVRYLLPDPVLDYISCNRLYS